MSCGEKELRGVVLIPEMPSVERAERTGYPSHSTGTAADSEQIERRPGLHGGSLGAVHHVDEYEPNVRRCRWAGFVQGRADSAHFRVCGNGVASGGGSDERPGTKRWAVGVS